MQSLLPLPSIALPWYYEGYGDRVLEADGPGPDLRSRRNPPAARGRPGFDSGVGRAGRENRGPAGRSLQLGGHPPSPFLGSAQAPDARGAEGGSAEVRERASCAPLTPTSWSGWRPGTTPPRPLPPRPSSPGEPGSSP